MSKPKPRPAATHRIRTDPLFREAAVLRAFAARMRELYDHGPIEAPARYLRGPAELERIAKMLERAAARGVMREVATR